MKWSIPAMTLACALMACNANPKSNDTASSTSTTAVSSASASADLTPEQLGELGARITKHKDEAKKILSEQGLDEKTFEAKIRKVTEDPEASKRYAAAYEKAKANG